MTAVMFLTNGPATLTMVTAMLAVCLATAVLYGAGVLLGKLPVKARIVVMALVAVLIAGGLAYADEDPALIYYCPKVIWILGMPVCWDFEW